MTRRTALARCAAVVPAIASWPAWARPETDVNAALAELEARHGGRLGVASLDEGNAKRTERRANERFPMCSTFKLLAAALVLTRVDRGEERPDRRIAFDAGQLVPYSPATGTRTGPPGMTVAELCEAAMTVSDNTAANLLLASFGGPRALTAYARSLGDTETRLDRIEPDLNEATPGDPRDTTTPAAMLHSVRRLVLGDALSTASRSLLTTWLVANTTGNARVRAGLPSGWRVGDKTGSGNHATTNDVAVAWPPDRPPVVLAVYYSGSSGSPAQRNAVVADVARIVVGRR